MTAPLILPLSTIGRLEYDIGNKYGRPGFDDLRDMIRYGMMWKLVKNLPESEKGKKDDGLHYKDNDGEFVRIGKDENQAIFQLLKSENKATLDEFTSIIQKRAKQVMSEAQGQFDPDDLEGDVDAEIEPASAE